MPQTPCCLDLIELTMEVESAFGVEIRDDVASNICNPGELKRYLRSVLPAATDRVCLTQRGFHRLRATLTRILAVPRSAIRPETTWSAVVPGRDLRRLWAVLGRRFGRRPPCLKNPWKERFVVACGLLWLGQLAGIHAFGNSLYWFLALLLGTSLLLLLYLGTSSLQWQAPGHVASVGATARFLAATAPSTLKRSNDGWSPEEISEVVNALVERTLRVGKASDAAWIPEQS